MKHDLTLFFKMEIITEFMDKFDMTDGSSKVFCHIFDISIDTDENWYLSPAVVEVLDEQLGCAIPKITNKDACFLCGIYDHTLNVFYNFTDVKDHITMFSNGKNFVYFNTKEDIKQKQYIDAYKKFIFNNKQAKNDRYTYLLSGWFCNNQSGDKNVSCK